MIRSVQLLACAVIASVGSSAGAQTAPQATTIVVTGDRSDADEDNRRICRREVQTGSVMSRRVCRTRSEWNRAAARAQNDLDRMRQQETARGIVGQSRGN